MSVIIIYAIMNKSLSSEHSCEFPYSPQHFLDGGWVSKKVTDIFKTFGGISYSYWGFVQRNMMSFCSKPIRFITATKICLKAYIFLNSLN